MAVTKIQTPNQFQIKKFEGAGAPNFIDSQYIGTLLEPDKAHIFEKMYMKLFSARQRFIMHKPLIGGTGTKNGTISGGTIELDKELFQWKLYGADYRYAVITENLELGNTTPGLNQSLVKIKIDIDYFHAPDIISLEDPDILLDIVDGPIPDDTGSIYLCRVSSDNNASFVNPIYLQTGRRVTKVSNSVGTELNTIGGSSRPFPGYVMLENQIGRFANTSAVTDEAWRTQGQGIIYYTDKDGKSKTTNKFLPLAEARLVETHYMDIEYFMMYGKRSTGKDTNGYIKRKGSGLREQLKDSWNRYSTGVMTEDMLTEYLMDIFFSRVDESDRKQIAYTGTVGSIQLHKLLAARASGLGLTILDSHWIKSANDGNPRHLSYGAQYTHYSGVEGIEFSVDKLWYYDSKEFNGIPHPFYPKYPIDSGRLTFLNWGTAPNAADEYNGSNNIMMLKRKDVFSNVVKAGRLKPSGLVASGEVNDLTPGYTHFIESSAGIVLFDPTQCGEIITDVNVM